MELLVQLRKRYTVLSEIYDLTTQMGEALDRNDQTSFTMLLAMRQEPILLAQEYEKNIQRICESNPPEQKKRWESLLEGDVPHSDAERLLTNQLEQNKRIIGRLVPLDQRIYKALGAKKG
ncbi:MAG: hypothetical protein Q3Y08_00240 [Butyricicoccus sp.]|nr:hypothetical protein [Butyricicoccus sp.]